MQNAKLGRRVYRLWSAVCGLKMGRRESAKGVKGAKSVKGERDAARQAGGGESWGSREITDVTTPDCFVEDSSQ